jgi:hypothetical protein
MPAPRFPRTLRACKVFLRHGAVWGYGCCDGVLPLATRQNGMSSHKVLHPPPSPIPHPRCSYMFTFAAVVVAIPVCIRRKSYWPLAILGSVGSIADLGYG